MFNGEAEKGEEAEASLSGMKKYFQIYNYSDRLKFKMAIYNLTGKVDIWWQEEGQESQGEVLDLEGFQEVLQEKVSVRTIL